jgi:hypothetical protein
MMDKPGSQGFNERILVFPLGHGRTCPGHPDNPAPCYPDRDRRDKPGDDDVSFAPLPNIK